MARHMLIVGAGQAAVQAIVTMRRSGVDAAITLIGDERHAPYQRPPLSKKYLAGEMPRERLALRPPGYYAEQGVHVELGVRAAELDAAARRVRLEDGRSLSYDWLLIATGSRARRLDVPGADLPGAHYLRSIDDVDAMLPSIEPGRRLVLVGAGYIGLEVAAVAAARGLDVTVLEAGERVMNRVVCPPVSDFYDRYHAEAGVKLRYGAEVIGLYGRERVESVETSDGERYACDIAIIGIGVEPNTALAESAGLACTDGVLVDAYASTEDPAIAAAGDCTRHPHPLAAGTIRLESVQNAIEQGKNAALGFAGEARAYDEVPWFWSDQYDLKLQIAGLSGPGDELVVRGDPAEKRFAAYHLRERRLVAVEAVNSPRDYMLGRKAIAAGLEISGDLLADPHTDLTMLLGA